MAGLSRAEILTIIKHIEPQGVTVEKTRDGMRLLLPNGKTAGLHWTSSDRRAHMALRSELKRAGVTWPWDHQKSKEKMMKTDASAYISGRKPQKRTLDNVQGVLNTIHERGDTEVNPSEVVKMGGANDLATVYKAMATLGYQIVGRRGKSRVWAKEGVKVAEKVVAPVAAADPGYPEISKAATLAPVAPPALQAAPGPREFIDTHDSWTIELKSSAIGDLTVRSLRQVLLASGLQVELRVWKADPAERDAFFNPPPKTPAAIAKEGQTNDK